MPRSPFHIYAKTREFAEWMRGDNRLLAAYASADIKVFPYQIAAAMFALRSPYLKGVILADEGSLGKTYEALLVASQRWIEGRVRQLLILPCNLVEQWVKKIEEGFTLPYVVWDNGDIPIFEDEEESLIITTYDFAIRNAEKIASLPWDLAIFDEADALFKPEGKTASILKAAVGNAFKLLLTPTPITRDIMDVYGLIHFIDESVLPDAKEFYKRYFRKPENYPELSEWVSQFAFRTLKSQVVEYVNFTHRIPFNPTVKLTVAERTLYENVARFIALPRKTSFPKMEEWELSLMLHHSLSSSPQAFCKTIAGAIQRAEGSEQTLLQELRGQAEAISITGKMEALLDTLKATRPSKAIVFTDNLTTLHALQRLLESEGHFVVTTEQPDYAAAFRRKRGRAVLLATDSAAKGLDFEFCPVVINYDLLFNAIEMEQRITRCHRQGQQADVLVVNLLYKENLADVRILELINKRVKQFDGIFGMSDPIVGNFDAPIEVALSQIRPADEIAQAFVRNLETNKDDNKTLVGHAEDILFTTFTKEIADKITLTPDYVEEKIEEFNARMWEVVKGFFVGRDDYEIDDEARVATLREDERPWFFTYFTGSRNRHYYGRGQYGTGRKFRRGDRIVPTSPLIKGLLAETSCTDRGTITVAALVEPCEIGFYRVGISADHKEIATFDVLCGLTDAGRILSDEECRAILRLPVASWTEEGDRTEYWLRNSVETENRPCPIDRVVPIEALKERARNDGMLAEEIERIKLRAIHRKSALEHSLDDLRQEVKAAEQALAETSDRMGRLEADKRLKLMRRDLRQHEDGQFLERMRIDLTAEEEVKALSKERYEVWTTRHFVVKVTGKNDILI